MAELFLQDLNHCFVARNISPDFGIDFFVGFKNPQGGVNLVGIEVKATQQPVNGRFQFPREKYNFLANFNIPVLLLVVDVKENRFYYSELDPIDSDSEQRFVTIKLAELIETSRRELTEKLTSSSLNKHGRTDS